MLSPSWFWAKTECGHGQMGQNTLVQKCEFQVTVDPGLELNLNLKVEVQTKTKSVRLAAIVTAALALGERTASDASESSSHAADRVGGGLTNLTDAGEGVSGKLGERAAVTAASLVLLRALSGLLLALGLLLLGG